MSRRTLETRKLGLSPDGRRLASAGVNGSLPVWGSKSFELSSLHGKTQLHIVTLSPGRPTANILPALNLWRAWASGTSPVCDRYTPGTGTSTAPPLLISWSPDGQYSASGGFDGVQVWRPGLDGC